MKKIEVLFRGAVLISLSFFVFPFAHAEPVSETPNIEVTPSFLFVGTKGHRAKFEEDNWTSRNSSGGINNMRISKKLNKQDSLEFEGRAIAGNNDYAADLNFSREGVGSLTVAFKEFRKYYDGTGGFYENFATTNFHPAKLDKDLHLDIGNFNIEGILAKEDSPEYSFGYEREFRHGSKSLVSWGPLTDGTITRYINPTYIDLDETVDKVKLGMKHVTNDAEVSVRQSWESAKSESSKINNQTTNLISGLNTNIRRKFENTDSDLYTTELRLSKDFDKNLFMSFGMLYNRYVGGSMEQITDTSTTSYNENHPLNPASIHQDTVTILPNLSFSPLKDLLMGLGLKAEFDIKNSNSTYNRDYRNALGAFTPDGIIDEFVNIVSDTDQKRFSGNIKLKYNRIKNAVFYADAGLEKQFISQFEIQDSFGPNPASGSSFSRKTNTVADTNNFTLGCKWYPVSKVNVTVEDKYKNRFVDNKNEFLTGDVVTGYRGFIDRMELKSNSPIVKFNYKPFRWVTATLGYTLDQGTYGIRTRAGSSTEIAKYIINAYSTELTLTPTDYFYCSLFYERRNDLTSTRANGAGGAAVAVQQPDYKANVDVLGLDYSYALTKATTLNGSYSMYFTDNFNDFSSTGLPLGLNNLSQGVSIGVKHSFKKERSLEVKYIYKNYAEASNNHINDYEAHLVSAVMNMTF